MFEQTRFAIRSRNLRIRVCRFARILGVFTFLFYLAGFVTCIMELDIEHMIWTLLYMPFVIAITALYEEVPSSAILLRIEPVLHLFHFGLRGVIYILMALPIILRLPVAWIVFMWTQWRVNGFVTYAIVVAEDLFAWWYLPGAVCQIVTGILYIIAKGRKEDGDDIPQYHRVMRGY
ncbi:hypothetical protein J8273_0145 [Carpediemonas membranifera]|uniref:Uncharacterized protein n=1 Tax=Carpediemonas membranifera TaxID=201153 RepID=A0A8J6B8I8_9EUKA|nr:hypothetical protein J8273_0145 [Carpediemonas membranifera]|eukprot:KAG9394937.1 hypothetical protein J8273_0145 [Carpediemonas membranifera]